MYHRSIAESCRMKANSSCPIMLPRLTPGAPRQEAGESMVGFSFAHMRCPEGRDNRPASVRVASATGDRADRAERKADRPLGSKALGKTAKRGACEVAYLAERTPGWLRRTSLSNSMPFSRDRFAQEQPSFTSERLR